MFARGVLASFVLLGACNTARVPSEPEPGKAKPAAATPAAPASKAFGAPLGGSAKVTLADVMKHPDKFADKTVTVEGDVRQACTKKGCWMELSESPDPKGPACRVTFKDYGFFVPTDSAGSKARVEAKVETKQVKPAMVQHLEEEGAKFAEKSADGSATEVRLVATGVELWR
jgi:hypothetical protein